jgi:Family of unknown function (DUF5681)
VDPVSKSRISGSRERSLANLKKFQPGVSGNPSGRPKKSLMTKGLEKLSNDKHYVPEFIEAVKKRMLLPGVAGVLETREFMDRTHGKVVETVDMNVSGTLQLAEVIEQRRKKRGERNSQS